MEFNLKQICVGDPQEVYTCRVDGLFMCGYGKGIEESINDFLKCYEYYSNRGVR